MAAEVMSASLICIVADVEQHETLPAVFHIFGNFIAALTIVFTF